MAIYKQERNLLSYEFRLTETLLAHILYYAEQIRLTVEQLKAQNQDNSGRVLNHDFDFLLRMYRDSKNSPDSRNRDAIFAKNVDNIKLLMAKGVTREYHHVLEVASAMLKPQFKIPETASPYAKACAEKGLLDTHQHQARNALAEDELLLPPLINIVREYMEEEVEFSLASLPSEPFYPKAGLSEPIPYELGIDNYIEAEELASEKPITKGKEEDKESTVKNSLEQGSSTLSSSSYWTNSVSSSNTQAPLSSSNKNRASAVPSSTDSSLRGSSAPPISEERRQAEATIQQLCMGTDTLDTSTATDQATAGNQNIPATEQPSESHESQTSAVPNPRGYLAAVKNARQARKIPCERCVIS
jgi:hypothetical protein